MRKLVIILALLLAWPAQADRLFSNSHPAERARGCSWADTFTSQANVEANGGTVTGAPTFSPDSGVTLDGSSDLITYNLTGGEMDSANISFVIIFTPDFAYDENQERHLFDTTNGEEYSVVKKNNADSNVLSITLGNTLIADVASATYSAAWLQNQRNVLSVYGTSGSTSATLNETLILNADATAWTLDTPSSLIIGAEQAGGSKYDGEIHTFKIFLAVLVAQEVADYYNHATWTYLREATGLWDLTMALHDPTAVKALDGTGNGNDATLGDGSTPGTYPTKLPQRGHTFDGSDDYFSNMPALPGAYTVIWMDGDGDVTFENTSTTWDNIKASGSHSGNLLFLGLIPSVLTTLQELDAEIWLHKRINEI